MYLNKVSSPKKYSLGVGAILMFKTLEGGGIQNKGKFLRGRRINRKKKMGAVSKAHQFREKQIMNSYLPKNKYIK